MHPSPVSCKRHRFPPEIIAHVVWFHCRFNLSFREIEDMLLQRGIDASYETIRFWRAVDQNGLVLDQILQSKRDERAAQRLLRRLFGKYGRPKRIITDKLRSYGTAWRKLAAGLASARKRVCYLPTSVNVSSPIKIVHYDAGR